MKLTVLTFASVAWATFSTLPHAEVAQIDWAKLVDPAAQQFEDPFAALSEDELDVLRKIVRLRSSLEDRELSPENTVKLQHAEAQLESTGIDVDWLLDQRWAIADRREKAATLGNPEVAGTEVQLAGFAIPGPEATEGTSVFYLVPERGMCSHTPPPSPNQLIKVSMPGGWSPRTMHEPVRLTGVLSIAPSEQKMTVVDGLVNMHATFAMNATDVETLMTKAELVEQFLRPGDQNTTGKFRSRN